MIERAFSGLTPEKEMYRLVSDRVAVRTNCVGELLGFGHRDFSHVTQQTAGTHSLYDGNLCIAIQHSHSFGNVLISLSSATKQK